MLKFEDSFKSSIKSNILLLNLITNFIIRQKRNEVRRMVLFLSAKLHGAISESTFTALSLIELLHTATLIHDDVTHESIQNQKFFSIRIFWRSKIAVLMGDYLLSKGLLMSIQNKTYYLLEIVSDAVREISEGELLQIHRSRTLNITQEQYLEILRKKTGYLISACAICGTKSAGGTDEAINLMKLFGEYIGMSIQIKDDILHYKSNKFMWKQLKEKKLTLPIICALEKSSKNEKNEILGMISNSNKKNKNIRSIRNFVKKKEGLEYASLIMHEFKNDAIQILSHYPESKTKSSMIELANYCIERNK